MEYLTKVQMDRLDVSALTEDRKNTILTLKNSINVNDKTSLMNFGDTAIKGMNDFSSTTLKTIKLKEFPDIENILGELMGELQKVDSNTLLTYKPPFWKRLFGISSVDKFIEGFSSQFETAEGVIDKVKRKLEDAKYQIGKDINLCENFYVQNLQCINELDNHIFAGRLKLQEMKDEIANDLATLDKEDELAVHMLSEKQNRENRFEMNLHNLCLIRESAVQKMHEISMIMSGDEALIDLIKQSINRSIPTWESQMLVAFVVARQQSCVDLEKAITDTTNKMIAMNSELVKSGAIKIAQELQRGIIDIEVLKTSNQRLMETIQEVNKINMEGKKKRVQAIEELGKISISLNKATLLETEKM